MSHAAALGLIALTLAAYLAGDKIHRALGGSAFANPVAIGAALIAAFLLLSGLDYTAYQAATLPLNALLPPVVTALAVPIWRARATIRRHWRALGAGLLAGSVTAIASAVGLGALLGLDRGWLATLAPKSTTTPAAIALADRLGGYPNLGAVIAVLTGLITVLLLRPTFGLLRLKEPMARGFATGLAGHGVATGHLLQSDPAAAGFAGLALALNTIATSVLAPLLWLVLGW